MSYYLKQGEILWPTSKDAFDIRHELPVGTYTVGHSQRGFFLQPISDFKITGKVYGNTTQRAERILNTFRDRPATTGVMLDGEKGSGKTMLAKMISELAQKEGVSTLVINSAFCGDAFNTFIQSINEPCVIVFDEFEKVYDEKEQEAILTLLDGVYPTKKLFLLTCNDKYRVNTHMRNRPGRIFYSIKYAGLTADFIREYCNDNLENKAHIEKIVQLTMMFDSFNFDMLKALVEEMNRYNESPREALELLNAKPHSDGHIRHNIRVLKAGMEIPMAALSPNHIRGNPVTQENITFHINMGVMRELALKANPGLVAGGTGVDLSALTSLNEEEEEDETWDRIDVTQEHLRKIDPEDGSFTYVMEEEGQKLVVVFTREHYGSEKVAAYNWIDAY